MSIYNLYNNLVDSGKYSIVPSSNYQQNLENNIKQNYSGANYFRNSTSEMAKDYINRAETPTGKALMNVAMAAGAVPVGAASLLYDAYQALNRYDKAPAPEIGLDSIVPENMYRGKTNFIDTYKKEQPITAAYNRAKGMVDPLAESLSQELSNFDLKNTLSNIFSTKANASEALDEVPYSELDDFEAQNAGQTPAGESRGIMDLLKSGAAGVKDLFLEGAGATGGLNIGARLGMMVNPALAIPGALAGAFLGSKVTEMGPSGSFYAGLTDEQQDAVDEIYGDKGIMAGYNPVSMFGKGAAGAIDTRIGNIMQTLQKQALEGKVSEVLEQRQRDLQAERDRITGTIRDASGRITGGSGQGTIDSGNTGGYGGTGGEGPSSVSSSGMLGGGV
jgi:hypothetical protein